MKDSIVEVGSNDVKVLDFRMKTKTGTEIFGINVSKVVEIVPSGSIGRIASVPGAPDSQMGMVSLRERTYPVFDMGAFLGLDTIRRSDREKDPLVITEFSNLRLGFFVHEAARIRHISWKDLQPVAETNAGEAEDRRIVGTVILPPDGKKENSEIMLVLDLEGMAKTLGFFASQEEESDGQSVDPLLSGRKILVVDDSPSAQGIILKTLRGAGAEADLADNGQKALDLVLSHPGHYDLVLSDVEMPIMDGYALAKSLSERPGTPPVVLHSSMSGPSNVKKGIAAGAIAYLVKLHPRHLVEEIGRIFSKK